MINERDVRIARRDLMIIWLNDLLSADPVACAKLLNHRVEFDPVILKLPGDIVSGGTDERPTVGPLGLLNGALGDARIAVKLDDVTGEIVGFDAYDKFASEPAAQAAENEMTHAG